MHIGLLVTTIPDGEYETDHLICFRVGKWMGCVRIIVVTTRRPACHVMVEVDETATELLTHYF